MWSCLGMQLMTSTLINLLIHPTKFLKFCSFCQIKKNQIFNLQGYTVYKRKTANPHNSSHFCLINYSSALFFLIFCQLDYKSPCLSLGLLFMSLNKPQVPQIKMCKEYMWVLDQIFELYPLPATLGTSQTPKHECKRTASRDLAQ